MGTSSAERMKLHRDRKRLGLRPVQVLVSEQDIDYLLAKDYELTRTDDRSIGSAVVSAFLSDSVLEELMTPEGTNNV
jgi:hypothetical protein